MSILSWKVQENVFAVFVFWIALIWKNPPSLDSFIKSANQPETRYSREGNENSQSGQSPPNSFPGARRGSKPTSQHLLAQSQ